MKVLFNSWFRGAKKICNDSDTLYQLDGFNKTRYSRRKNQEGLLELASQQAHEQKKVYFATIYDGETPYCFLEIQDTVFNVGFLDNNKQNYLMYYFRDEEEKDQSLFLKKASYFEYGKDKFGQNEIIKRTDYIFQIDGTFTVVIYDNLTNEREILTAKKPLSQEILSHLWVTYPEFGKYDELIKIDRVPSEVFL